jgi:predicted DNA-binding transcriptional regulator YafY
MGTTEKRFIQMLKTLEQIISIFKDYPNGLKTAKLYEEMRARYGYNQTSKNLKVTYLSLLEAGAIKGVEFTTISKGEYRVLDMRFDTALAKEKKVYIKLALESVENLENISKYHNEICDALHLNKLDIPFYIKPENYQKLNTDEEEVSSLEEAIVYDYIISFRYKGVAYHVEPYRLVNFDGIWYLYGRDIEETQDNDHKTWILEFIEDVEVFYSQKHNTSDEEIEEELENAHDALFVPNQKVEVTLDIASNICDIIKLKEHFPNQQIIQEMDSGMRIKSTISTFEEIIPEIKSFIPHIRVISPKELKEKIEEDIKQYLHYL